MRKLDLLQISRHLNIANDNDLVPNGHVPVPPAPVQEPPPRRAPDALDPRRGGVRRGSDAASRGHAPPLPRALRPRRRS